ncbi:hypothetical protein CSQ79_08820 [Gloeocapsopsis sp. IPPAS B-1203]|nr:hypothetical protein CSQ79_08820 [Gloeocapsopsis sp. IPPAS B-1203]
MLHLCTWIGAYTLINMPKVFEDESQSRYCFYLSKTLREAVNLAREKTNYTSPISTLIRDLLIEYVKENDVSLRDVKQFGVSKYRQLQQEKFLVDEQNRSLRSELSRTRHDYENLQANLNNMISQGRIV